MNVRNAEERKSVFSEMFNAMTPAFMEMTQGVGMKMRGFEVISKYAELAEEDRPIIPTRGSSRSAGYDLRSYELAFTLKPGQTKLFATGIKAFMSDDEFLDVRSRSSTGVKKRCIVSQGVGTVDADYYDNPDNEGHIFVPLTNMGDKDVIIEFGERIAQGVFSKYLTVDGDNVITQRNGGFGSTNER